MERRLSFLFILIALSLFVVQPVGVKAALPEKSRWVPISLLQRSKMFIALDFSDYPAPPGAECKSNGTKHIALRWSANLLETRSYKHGAPLEHFCSATTFRVKPVKAQAGAPSSKLQGRWRVTFKMSGLEKNVIFAAGDNGAGSFKLLDTAPDDKPVAQPVPAVWSQLTNDRISFSGEAELPIGTCCREVGTMIFKGKFTSGNEIRGTLIFVTSVDQEESAFKFRSEVGTFTANRILN